MNDSRVTATVRYRSGDVWAECSVCGAESSALWEIGSVDVGIGDEYSPVDVVDVTWATRDGVPGACFDIDGEWWHEPGSCRHCAEIRCPHVDLSDMEREVENYLERNNRPQSEPDPDRFRDDNEGRYDG